MFRAKTLVNYCPNCKVVLSNEDSQGGKCDVCHSDVVQLPKDVWYLKITAYADKLLNGLNDVDYPDSIKQQEVDWIGKSVGAFVNFQIKDVPEALEIYTTRCDTLYGVTFMVVAPEHPMLDKYRDRIENWDEVISYRAACAKKTEFERTQLSKEKTGVKLSGFTAINPVSGKEIPVFIADYVMMGYGTGAIMAVPAHDQRDWEFAKKFGVNIIPVIEGGDIEKEAYTGDGRMINSDFLNAYDNKKDSIAAMLAYLDEHKLGRKGIQYKMKDWAFNRQRYWGEPIPLIHCEKCGTVGVPYEELPLKLPDVENFAPGTDGQSPLARIESFVNCTCPKCGGPAKRETDTMPQWAGSSWYYLRFIDPHNDKVFCDPEEMQYWMPVDWYNGGMEHVTRHLLYSRFWHHFLYDIGEVNTPEPYAKRTYQGLILGPDGEKMSKSKGNVVDPINVIDRLGADTLRVYVMFMGDYMAATPWSEESANGCKRFLDRIWRLQDMVKGEGWTDNEMRTKVNACIKKVGEDYERMKFNTAIAAMMSLVNDFYAKGALTKDEFRALLLLLDPVAPHISEELNERLGFAPLHHAAWPAYDPDALVENTIEYGVQVNGKIRARVKLPVGMDNAAIVEAALALDDVKPFTEGKTIRKTIVVKNIINLVVG